MIKEVRAWEILLACFGSNGVWADPTRYRNQCWTRDFAFAIQPFLLARGHTKMARKHLINLSARVREDGRVPILYLDNEQEFVAEKERKSKESGKPSFMLTRYREGELWNLTPGTKDSEILYLLAMFEYAMGSGDGSLLEAFEREINQTLNYVAKNLVADGLVHGADWRDTMHIELADKALLTNNSIWYAAVKGLDSVGHLEDMDHAERIREKLLQTHFTPDLLDDYPGRKRFDPLGASLAVLYDVVDKSRYDTVLAGFRSVDSPAGVTIHCKHNPLNAEEAAVIERTDGQVVWPFIVGFSVLALLKMGSSMADAQFRKLEALEGFREWYDPETGKGYGAEQQLWSATLYLRALKAMTDQG
jgi:glycogen debranching enzyme